MARSIEEQSVELHRAYVTALENVARRLIAEGFKGVRVECLRGGPATAFEDLEGFVRAVVHTEWVSKDGYLSGARIETTYFVEGKTRRIEGAGWGY